MSLYFIRHQHTAQTCPAKNPQMGQMLNAHLSPKNASTFGIRIHSDAVLDNQHTLVLIVDSASQAQVEQYMEPFKMAGSVEIWPASTCEVVVERGGCEA